jgi:hypothetical protein
MDLGTTIPVFDSLTLFFVHLLSQPQFQQHGEAEASGTGLIGQQRRLGGRRVQ